MSTARSLLTKINPAVQVLLDPQPTTSIHRLGDIHQQRVRHRVPAVGQQRVDHLLGVVARRAGVPEPEGVSRYVWNVLRRTLQLGKRRDRDPTCVGIRMINFEEQRPVGLHDERPWAVEGSAGISGGYLAARASSPVGVASGESDSASGPLDLLGSAVGVGDSEGGFGVGVACGEGNAVTTNVGELRLWFPAASRARIWTTCWPLSSLNQCSFARVSAVVATSNPLSQIW